MRKENLLKKGPLSGEFWPKPVPLICYVPPRAPNLFSVFVLAVDALVVNLVPRVCSLLYSSIQETVLQSDCPFSAG